MDALTLDLPADASAPRIARTAVADLVGDEPRREDLLLCVSEVVTNAVLHAGTASQLRVRTAPDRIVVEVADTNPTMPIRRQHDLQAPTGRGLLLLDALTIDWGTKPVEGGKIVWFELELGGGQTLGAAAGSGTCVVELVGLPLAVIRRAAQHGEALRRELALLAHARTPGFAPMRLYELGMELAPAYQGLNDGPDQRLREALETTAESIDLQYVVPVRAADDLQRVAALLDELDQYCIDRDLLTLVTPPEGLAFRRWWLGEMIEQVRDRRPPRPWSDDLVAAVEATPPPEARDDGDDDGRTVTIEVEGDLDLEQAPALRERLLQAIDDGAHRIVVDLARCPFLDSTGISLLVTTHLRLEAEGGGLRLANLGPAVASVVDLAGLDEMVM